MSLPLADRVLLALQLAPASARALARYLGCDVHSVHGVLRGLRAAGVVAEQPIPGEGSRWGLAPGVRVVLRPATVLVEGASPPPAMPPPARRCGVVMTRGRPCRMRAGAEGWCILHRPWTADSPSHREPPSGGDQGGA